MRAAAAVSLLVLMVIATPAGGQDRMPPIPSEKLTAAQRQAAEAFRKARSADVFGPFVPLLRSPEVMTRARAMGDYLRFASSLPPRLSEFVVLITARQWTQNYEWSVHAPLAARAGLGADTIDAVAEGRTPDRLQPDEEIVYALCDEIRRNQSVSDATYSRAVDRLGEQGVIDALALEGYYTMLAMVLNTARTPLPPGEKPSLAPLPR